MIESLRVKRLNGRYDGELKLHPDLNVITGRNGSGKTTLLKLLWYMTSGNMERIPQEMEFQSIHFKARGIEVSLEKLTKKANVHVSCTTRTGTTSDTVPLSELERHLNVLNVTVVRQITSSVFFPTFRRMEGGFSTERRLSHQPNVHAAEASELEQALNRYSDRLSVIDRPGLQYEHYFVAALSSGDIERWVVRRLAELGRELDLTHRRFAEQIERAIASKREATTKPEQPEDVPNTLALIEGVVEKYRKRRDGSLKRVVDLAAQVKELLGYDGVRFRGRVALGDESLAVAAETLSAGEKQILSFLCYNAIVIRESVMMIDEPELSLHVDWQRALVPCLLKQRTKNQLILATHSPFIYSQYPDKEIRIMDDRGC